MKITVLNKNTLLLLIGKINPLFSLVGFTIIAALLSAVMQYCYAELIYFFQLYEDFESVRESVFYFFSIDIYVYTVGSAIFYMLLILPVLKKITHSKAGRKYLLLSIILVEIIIIFIIGGNFTELFTIRALIEIVIYIFPTLLINYFLWNLGVLKSWKRNDKLGKP